jgi:superfamily II DNA or RNA helicase
MAGRALRPYPGKENCVILDHAGCIRTFGFPSEDQNWELTTDKIKPPIRISTADPFKICPDCECTVGTATKECPNCGYTFSSAEPKNNTPTDEHLVEVKPGKRLTEQRKRQKYELYLWTARHLRKRDGTPYHPKYPEVRYKNEFGQWPPKTWKFEWLQSQLAGGAHNQQPRWARTQEVTQ